MHYYQHHIGDFIKDTSFLTNEEVGIYLKLLWIYYDSEKPLPNSLFELLMKVNARDQMDALKGILEMFFTLEGDEWHHTRCDNEIEHYHRQLETASKAGKASAAKRALNKSSTTVQQESNDRSTDVQPTNNQQPRTKNQKPSLSPAPAVLDERFERFWKAYPKKTGKDAAMVSFKKRKPDDKLLNEMVFALGQQKKSPEWLKDNGQFIPNPATWLNQGRWKDEGLDLDKPANPFAGDI
jgi:uncharacterized protein YdaU (DUF1376 family)